MDVLKRILNSDVVLLAFLGSLALWGLSLFVIWQEKKKKKKQKTA
ncbi:hypothetical protein [Aquifex pyrophilus]